MTRRFRLTWLAIAVALLAALAGGYAWYRSYVAEQLGLALNNWILARTAEGYRIDADIAPESGNWLAATRTLSDVTIAAPRDDWDIRLPSLDIQVDAWNPFKVQFHPGGRADVRYSVADVEHRIASTILGGSAGFTYDTSGQATSAYVDELSSSFEGPVDFEFRSLRADARFDPKAAPSSEDKSVEFKFLLEDTKVTRPYNLPLGDLIKRVEMDAYVAGMLRPGRPSESLAAWRDAGGVLQIQKFAADWGPLAITAEGTLALDGNLQPLFAGTANVRGYNETIDALAQAGMMELGQVTGAKIALAAMTKPGDDGEPPAAKLPITIQDGFLFVGPLKLAQMPRIVWQ